MYIDHPQFPRPKSQPNLLCSLLIGIDPMYAYHSQWNRTPTYQLTKSNIFDDVSRTEGVASRTHIEIKVKRNEETTSKNQLSNYLLSFTRLALLFIDKRMKGNKDLKFNERLAIFFHSSIHFFHIKIDTYT